ncbi:MAG: hypothetical protein AAFQ43_04135 [Bacteroidota bacterium]
MPSCSAQILRLHPAGSAQDATNGPLAPEAETARGAPEDAPRKTCSARGA